MAVKFEFYESPNTIGTRKKRYHARVVNRGANQHRPLGTGDTP